MATKQLANSLMAPDGSQYVVLTDGAGNLLTPSAGSVTTVSVVSANGITGTVATATTTPAITLTLGPGYADTRASKTANYTVLSTDSNTQFDNTGAAGEVDFTLPTAASGLRYGFTVKANQVLKVIAGASTTISIGATSSASAGNISANTKYAHVELEAISTTEWVAFSSTGTWTVT